MNIIEYINSEDAEQRYDYESHVFENVWAEFVKHLPTEQDWAHHSVNVWYYADADEILCCSEELAQMIKNMILGISGEHEDVEIGYYDLESDEDDDCIDGRTDWWFVRFW